MSISLVAGLGNPGRTYEHTRHNLGWTLVDAWASRKGLAWKEILDFESEVTRWGAPDGRTVWFVKPLTFMNESGRAIGKFVRYLRLGAGSVAAVYDDLSIDLGLTKVSVGGSAAGHNGVASLIEHLGADFVRYRIGIGPRQPPEMDLKDFVLAKFTPEQLTLTQQKTDTYIQGLDLLLEGGPDRAMNQLNRRDTP